jgi:type IV secretion system protein TrbL
MYLLIAFDIVFIGYGMITGRTENILEVVWKFFVIGVMVYIITNFKTLSYDLVDSVCTLAGLNSSSASYNMGTDILTNPTSVLSYSYNYVIKPFLDSLDVQIKKSMQNGGPWAMFEFTNIKYMFMYGIFTAFTMICFCILTIQVCIASISWHICFFFAIMMLPFTLFEPTSFLGRNAFSSMAGQSLNCGVLVFITNIGLQVMQVYFSTSVPVALEWGNVFIVLCSSLLLAYLSIIGPGLVISLISGAPTLGAGGFASTMSNLWNTGRGIQRAITGDGRRPPQPQSNNVNGNGGSNTTNNTTKTDSTGNGNNNGFKGSSRAGDSPAVKEINGSSGASVSQGGTRYISGTRGFQGGSAKNNHALVHVQRKRSS